MNSKVHVLIVSRDEMLLRTREMILGAFFDAQGAGRVSEAKALLSDTPFDLIVLCHSLTDNECELLADMAHARDNHPLILAMNANSDEFNKPWADKQLGVDAGPYGLVKKCADMLGFALKSKAKAVHS
jgi:DNA-binding response OmpR family regulator